MRFSLLANAAAFALFAAVTAILGLCSWGVLAFQLVLQWLVNEFWVDIFMIPFKGQQIYGVEQEKLADPDRLRRMARRTSVCLLLLPALLFAGLAVVNAWGGGALAGSLHLPLGSTLFLSSLAAQFLLLVTTLAGGLAPLSYRTLVEALMARHERRLIEEGKHPKPDHTTPTPPTRAGVEALPHGLPGGVTLPPGLQEPQLCSPLHAPHAELVRSHLQGGERAILSTAPAGVVPLPSSSNERFLGGLLLCLAAILLYSAIGLFEDASSRVITRWVVLLLGLGLLPASIRILRASARRQSLLLRTDYFITNQRVHICRAGEWDAVPLVSMEVVPGGSYGEGGDDVELCPESGETTYTLVNVEHAEELCALLERLIYMENAR